MVGLAGEAEQPPPVRPDRRRDSDRLIDQIESPALLNVQFNVDPDSVGQCGIGAEVRRVTAGAGERLGQRDSVGVAETQCTPRRECAGGQLRPHTRHAEACALFVRECCDSNRFGGDDPAISHDIDGDERRHDSEWSVVRAAVGHRIEVRPGDEGVGRIALPAGRHPPRPEVPVPVFFDGHAAVGGGAGEPLAQRHVGVVPCEAPVAAGRGATDIEY